jgi:hypothetical protein
MLLGTISARVVRSDSPENVVFSGVEQNVTLTPELAKEALLKMLNESRSTVLRDFVEFTKNSRVEVLGTDTVKIGVWTCDLRTKTFNARLATPVSGRFVRLKTGVWSGVEVGDGDLPPEMRRFLNRMR